MWREFKPALPMMAIVTVLTGLLYPAAVTGLCQALFRDQANGSLLQRNGRVVGSALIGQAFQAPGYFHPRPSAAGNGYDPTASGGSNLGPTNQALVDRVRKAAADFRNQDPDFQGPIPADLLTASGSGLDPDISPAAAAAQVARVAQARGVDPARVLDLVQTATQGPQWGLFGDPRVNVLELNLALDREFPRQ